MSRIGKQSIKIPNQVTLETCGDNIKISGPLGSLTYSFPQIFIMQKEDFIHVQPKESCSPALWGTCRSRINAMIHGVNKGFTEELILSGAGIKATKQENILSLNLGKSHGFKILIEKDINVNVPSASTILLSSIDKILLSQFVAKITQLFPVEPYKGKGIKKKNQVVYMKEVRKK